MPPKAELAPTARLEAHFGVARGKTRMERYFGAAPLKIAKTFDLGEELGVCVMDCSPGLLAGDYYHFDWHLHEKSRVSISTQGFTRVHPSRENPCRLQQKIRLERGAALELFPEPLILFRDAALRSTCDVEMSAGATFLGAEITSMGRIGHGEAFEFHFLQSRWRVRCAGQLIFHSQTAVRTAALDFTRPGAWKNFTHQANFLVFCAGADAALQDVLQKVLDAQANAWANVWGGVSRLERGGILVSMLGRRACDLQEITRQLRSAARESLRQFSRSNPAEKPEFSP